MELDLMRRLERVEVRQKRTTRTAWVLAALLAASLASQWTRSVYADDKTVQQLRAHELVIVDNNGVERVRVGGDLPDAVINGKRIARGDKAAGVLIYDGRGQERGGYVTLEPSDNAVLTLDTRKSQVVLLVAGPEDGSAFMLRHDADIIEMRSDPDGTRLTGVRQGKVVFQDPEVKTLQPETCKDYRDARSRQSLEKAMSYCTARFTESTCSVCLKEK